MKIGKLFRYKRLMSIHTDLDGCIGVVLSKPNEYGQCKAQIKHKIIYVLRQHMGEL